MNDSRITDAFNALAREVQPREADWSRVERGIRRGYRVRLVSGSAVMVAAVLFFASIAPQTDDMLGNDRFAEPAPNETSMRGSSRTSAPTPTPGAAAPEDWELHSHPGGPNNEGFSFRYPAGWHVLSVPVSGDTKSASVHLRSQLPSASCDETQTWDDCATDYKLEMFAFKEGARSNWEIDEPAARRSPVVLGGVRATLYTLDQRPPFSRAYGVAVAREGFVYSVWLYSSLQDPDDSIVRDILASFLFTDE